jgi:uncharacterized protein YndB with AHSA1/START domain
MKTVHLSIRINAPREKVWRVMLEPDTYREWTAEFYPGSYYEGSWEQGESIQFLSPEGHGIASVIAESRYPEFVSIKHLGLVASGVVDTESPEAREWAPAFENYTFRESGEGTELVVDCDVAEAEAEGMTALWHKALAKLKELCE